MEPINKLLKLSLLLSVVIVSGQGVWENIAELPSSRAGHTAVVVDSLIYLMGGFENSQNHASNLVWSYDPVSDIWNQSLPPLNYPRGSFAAVARGDTIYVFGGRHMSNLVASVERYIIGSGSWEVIGTMPEARMGLGAALVNNQIFIFGGKSSRSTFALPSNQVEIFIPSTGTWVTVDSMNQARTEFAYGQKNNEITCAGGSLLDPISGAENYNPSSGWTEILTLPESISNCAAIYSQNNFIVLGGYTTDGISTNNYFLADGPWQEFPTMLVPRYDHTAVLVDNYIFVMGGRNGQHPISSHERYSIPMSNTDTFQMPTGILSIGNPYPNPFNSSFQFDVQLPFDKPNQLDIILYDISGRMVWNESRSRVTSGTRIGIRIGSTQNSSLSSGIYLLRVSVTEIGSSTQSISRQVLYLK